MITLSFPVKREDKVLILVHVLCYQGFQEQMMQNLSQMTDVIDPLATAAKSQPENIGHRVRSPLRSPAL